MWGDSNAHVGSAPTQQISSLRRYNHFGTHTYNEADSLNRTGDIRVTNPLFYLTELYRHMQMTRIELAHHMTLDPKSSASAIPPHPHKLGYRDLNPNLKIQSLLCYHYTIAHYYFSDPSDNTTRIAMLPLGISKEKKKYEKENTGDMTEN